MKHHIYNKVKHTAQRALLLGGWLGGGLLSSCYDLTEMSHNPYAIEGSGSAPTSEVTPVEDESKYADINLDYYVTAEDSAYWKDYISAVPSDLRSFLYQSYYSQYQRATNLTHDVYSGYGAYNQPKHMNGSPRYGYTDGWSAYRWEDFYNQRCTEYRNMLRALKFNSNPEHYKNMFYKVRIYMAFVLLAHTDTYGDMPCKEYVQAKIPEENNVPYDSQQDIYDCMFRMLEQAVDSINPEDKSQYNITDDDICYFGDDLKWLRFANTLRLRMALRISNVDPERARKEGEAALSNQYGLMESNDDNMQTVPKYAPASIGGEDAGGDENGMAMCSVAYNGEFVLSWDMEQFYRNLSTGGAEYTVREGSGRNATNVTKVIDPRCLKCWYRGNMTSETLAAGEESLREDYTGCHRNAPDDDLSMSVLKYSLTKTQPKPASKELNPDYYFNYSRPHVWLGYAESLFLQAEAVLRGWSGEALTMSVEDYVRAGIQASMDHYQVSAAEAQAYIGGVKCFADGTFQSGDKERILEALITHKWMAVFPNGNEGWADFRRTDYPALEGMYNAETGYTPNTSGDPILDRHLIKRLLYPNSESANQYFTSNTELQQRNMQSTRLWWDVDDTMDDSGNRKTYNNFR